MAGVLVYLVCLACIYCFSITSYQLFLSPLRRYPGPKLCAIIRLPWAWHTWRGDIVNWVQQLHLEYGHVVRIAPNELSYTDPDAWKDIYGHGTRQQGSAQKDPRFYGPTSDGTLDILRADDTNHRRFRRVFSNAFSESFLKQHEPQMREHVSRLIQKIKALRAANATEKFDLVRLFNHTTFDIMSDLCFGESLDLLISTKHHFWVDVNLASLKEMAISRIFRYYPWSSILAPLILPSELWAKLAKNFQLCVAWVDKRLAQGTSRPDVYTTIMDAKEGFRFSMPELYANTQTLMLAGTETTAGLLSGATYYLLRNPEVLSILTSDLRRTFFDEAEITLDRLAKLDYLQACIEEGLRMFPPAPVGVPRFVPKGGKTICGQHVPGNTIVSVYMGPAAQSPRNFTDPDSFIPERWLGDARFASDKRFASQAFSYGPRNCVGKSMAYHEARLILGLLLWHFDFSLCSEARDWISQLRVYGTWEKVPLPVQVAREA